jgi:methyltransferase
LVGEGAWLVAFVAAQRLVELALSARNTRRLLAQGGIEAGRAHYPLMVALHAAWLGTLAVLGHAQPVDRIWLAVLIILQAARIWVIATLGERWTTRIIVLPGARLVAAGPYRVLRHPNYWVVAAEIAVVPLALGLIGPAVVFSLLNAAVLAVRIRCENKALLG